MRYKILILAGLLAVLTSLCVQAQGEPRRVAVLPFKTAAGIQRFWQGDFDPGTAMTAIVNNMLVNSSRFQVYDRQNLDKIAQEQNLGIVGQVSPETAAQIGRLTGVQYLVTGTVVEFAVTKKSNTGGISIPGVPVVVGGGSQRLRVGLEIQVTDVSSGIISAALRGTGEEVVSNLAFGAFAGGIAVGTQNEEFANSGLGKAMIKAAREAVSGLDTVAFKEGPQFKPLEAVVIYVEGDLVTLNIGAAQGVVKGMRFNVVRPKQIIDPTTNQPRMITLPVGDIEVIAVDSDTCTCRAAAGASGFALRDTAKRSR